jgi:hypothetical protein
VSNISLLPDWVKGGSSATLFLTEMSKPRHGRLQVDENNQWYFCFGNNSDITKGVLLPDFMANCQSLIDSGQLFRGHSKFYRVVIRLNCMIQYYVMFRRMDLNPY